MPRKAPIHRTPMPRGTQHRPSEPSRQSRRALHTGSRQWMAIRRQVLVRDAFTCNGCQRYGDHVDHRDGDASNNDPENLQVLCVRCHSRKTAEEDGGFGNEKRIYI